MKINKTNFQAMTAGAGKVAPKKADTPQAGDKVELGGTKGEEGVHKKWLFMNYIAGDCNLKEFQANNIDMQEKVGSDENTHIVAMIDVGDMSKAAEAGEGKKAGESGEAGEKAEKSMITWSGARTFYVTKDNQPGTLTSPVVADHGQINMTDKKVLTNFIVETMKKYPADHVALIMNDHGGGYTGAMSDDGSGHGSFTMPQMKEALLDAQKITGKKLDIFGFDACLMADVQAAQEFKDVANFYLASEETEGGPGWTYNDMMDGHLEKGGISDDAKKALGAKKPKAITDAMAGAVGMLQNAMTQKITVGPEEFCKIVVKVNETHMNDIPTFSATDLTKIEGVTKAVDQFSKAIIKTDEKAGVQEAIMNSEAYGGWQQPKPYADMHDLGHMAALVEKGVSDPALKKAAQGVQKAIGEAVIANETDTSKFPNSKGLSIYAPVDKTGDLGYGFQELDFNKKTSWNDAMKEIGKVPTPQKDAKIPAELAALLEGGEIPPELAGLLGGENGEVSPEALAGLLGALAGGEGGGLVNNAGFGGQQVENNETPMFWPDGTPRQ